MKKTFALIILALFFSASELQAQNGLFGRGENNTENNEVSGSFGQREQGLDILLPDSHGTDDDYSAAPLGDGALLLVGFGAAYFTLMKKKRS